MLPPHFVRSWVAVVFLSVQSNHELFSVQGCMQAVLCSWLRQMVMLWSVLLPTIPCPAEDDFNTQLYSWWRNNAWTQAQGIVFLSSCLFLRHDHVPRKEPEINLVLQIKRLLMADRHIKNNILFSVDLIMDSLLPFLLCMFCKQPYTW